jgi:release factor glutamine methyltransferase
MNKKKKWNNTLKDKSLLGLRKNYLNDFRNKNEFYELIFYIKGWTKSDCFVYENDSFGEEDIKKFLELKEQLKTKPMSYVVKSSWFYGLNFFVDERVLIPRSETELIVDNIVRDKKNYDNYLDLCTGSGCIPIALSKYKTFKEIMAIDISSDALEVAKINCDKMESNIIFVEGDFLEPVLKLKRKFNLVTANPPYIDVNDKHVEDLVKNNEPHLALYAPEDGTMFYRKLFEEFYNIIDVTKPFKLISEFGFQQKEQIESLFYKSEIKYKINFSKDLAGHWRYFVIEN